MAKTQLDMGTRLLIARWLDGELRTKLLDLEFMTPHMAVMRVGADKARAKETRDEKYAAMVEMASAMIASVLFDALDLDIPARESQN